MTANNQVGRRSLGSSLISEAKSCNSVFFLTFRLATTNFGKMEALFSTNNAFKKAFLLFSWYYLVFSINKPLIARKVLAKLINEFSKREMFVLIYVKELLLEDGIISAVLPITHHVKNGFLPRTEYHQMKRRSKCGKKVVKKLILMRESEHPHLPCDLDHLIFLLLVCESHRSAFKHEQHKYEEGNVANVNSIVQKIDQLLSTGN